MQPRMQLAWMESQRLEWYGKSGCQERLRQSHWLSQISPYPLLSVLPSHFSGGVYCPCPFPDYRIPFCCSSYPLLSLGHSVPWLSRPHPYTVKPYLYTVHKLSWVLHSLLMPQWQEHFPSQFPACLAWFPTHWHGELLHSEESGPKELPAPVGSFVRKDNFPRDLIHQILQQLEFLSSKIQDHDFAAWDPKLTQERGCFSPGCLQC